MGGSPYAMIEGPSFHGRTDDRRSLQGCWRRRKRLERPRISGAQSSAVPPPSIHPGRDLSSHHQCSVSPFRTSPQASKFSLGRLAPRVRRRRTAIRCLPWGTYLFYCPARPAESGCRAVHLPSSPHSPCTGAHPCPHPRPRTIAVDTTPKCWQASHHDACHIRTYEVPNHLAPSTAAAAGALSPACLGEGPKTCKPPFATNPSARLHARYLAQARLQICHHPSLRPSSSFSLSPSPPAQPLPVSLTHVRGLIPAAVIILPLLDTLPRRRRHPPASFSSALKETLALGVPEKKKKRRKEEEEEKRKHAIDSNQSIHHFRILKQFICCLLLDSQGTHHTGASQPAQLLPLPPLPLLLLLLLLLLAAATLHTHLHIS